MAKTKEQGSRREHVLDVARSLFLEHGYDETSMDLVTREAGVSKQTLYRYFPNKESLFQSVAEALLADLGSSPGEATPPRTRAELEKALLRLASDLVATLMSPPRVALLRLLTAETNHAPRFGALYREVVVARTLQRVIAVVEQARRDCLVACEDPEAAAKLFVGGIAIHLLRDGLLVPDGSLRPPGAAELAAHVRLVLRALA